MYRAAMGLGIPDGVPLEAAEAARRTLAGATAAAELLPGTLGAELLGAARRAFAQGMEVTAMIGAVLAIALAVLAAVLLRRVRAGSHPS